MKLINKKEAETLLLTRGQPHLANASFAVSALTNPANKVPIRGLYFRAPAGAGKSSTARFIAEMTGAEFWEIPAGIRLPELISGNEEKGFKGLSHILNFERTTVPKVLYFEEFSHVRDCVRGFILDLADTAKETGTDKWGIIRGQTLLCLGTNEGVANPAIAGPSGRFLDVPLECLTPAAKRAKVIDQAKDYGCDISKGGIEALCFYAPSTHRGVENLCYRVFAGEEKANADSVLQAIRPKGGRDSICGPHGMNAVTAEILRVLVRATEPIRIATLQTEAGAGESSAIAWRSSLSEARAMRWLKAVTNGFIATEKAKEDAKSYAERVAEIRAIDQAPAKNATPAKVAPKKATPAIRKATIKGKGDK